MRRVIGIVVFGFALAACTEVTPTTTRAPGPAPAPPVVAPPVLPPAPSAPPPRPPPLGDCALDPADMSERTKVQCGLIERESAPPDDLEVQCSDAEWRAQAGPEGDARCGTVPQPGGSESSPGTSEPGTGTSEPGTGSSGGGSSGGSESGSSGDGTSEGSTPGESQDPAPNPQFEQYQDETGYPYSEQQYDELPGYLQCGTACGKEPTSGEVQREWLCRQGESESC